MSNLGTANITLPVNVISYYASTKGIDGKNCFNYWMRSKLVRIISDKPFARGDYSYQFRTHPIIKAIFSIDTFGRSIIRNYIYWKINVNST